MPEIEIRPIIASDIDILVTLDHHTTSDQVWQMDFNHQREGGQVSVYFRQVRLPRSVRLEYPRSPRSLAQDWTQRSGTLVALLRDQPIGYVSLMLNRAPSTAWATDLVVDRHLRRQGIGCALTLAAQEWGEHMGCHTLVLEMQPKNYPAIQMALKLGLEFCGYNDRYYRNQEIGIFFGKSLH